MPEREESYLKQMAVEGVAKALEAGDVRRHG